ncbi:hypothetical protein [Desulfatibacillum aliphaticivorans]|uniref:hypothetical protein n=1 Tax=Desulfatibacillum aliphaticivorans TaxID=218208 RepID=UPI0005C20B55|nr:hypothetical protein [Desulfatibacillum aliphaticivorans]
MKTQINLALLILTLFVGWLFFNTSMDNGIRKAQLQNEETKLSLQQASLELEKKRLNLETEKEQRLHSALNTPEYQIL